MKKSTLWLLLCICTIMALLVLSITLGWWNRVERIAGTWVWWALSLVLVAGVSVIVVGGIAVLREFIPRYWEKRFLSRLHSNNDDTPVDEEEESYRQLQAKMREAIQTLEKSPELRKKKGLSLYTVPWYLLIGASQSGKTTLLRSVANSFAPFAHPSSSTDTLTKNCDWWFFNTAIILDTAGHYAFPAKGERDSTHWYRFLQLLRSHRALQPINGLIITVAADTLITKRQEDLLLDAAELRKRIDEAIEELGVNFPIYLVLTRCDMLEGFTEFFACFPESTLQRVFGYINEAQPQEDGTEYPAGLTLRFAPVAETFMARLQQLRLSIFNEEKLPPEAVRQRIFCFPEEFGALQRPLTAFVEALLAANPFQHVPFFRGIFFTCAQQQGLRHSFLRRQLHFDGQQTATEQGTKAYFLHDFFAVILRRDQYLVKPTRKAIQFRRFKHLFGFSGCIALVVLLGLLLLQAFISDRKALAGVSQERCAVADEAQRQQPLLEAAEDCRQAVQTLIDHNSQRSSWGKLVFNRSGKFAYQLRQRYEEKFAAEVLGAIDAGIDQRLSISADTLSLVFLLINRLELLNQCLSASGCPEAIDKDMQPDYQLMLDPAQQRLPPPVQVASLQKTYEAYLHWASGSETVLQREQEAHAERLRRWFSSKQFAVRQILPWASKKYTPVTSQGYWDGLSTAEGKNLAQVDGAYTPGAWKQSILPFLQRAGDVVPAMEVLLKQFREEYYAQYFEQWRRFLAEFPRGQPLVREPRRRLVRKLLDDNSPYNRIIDVAFENLKPLLPTALATESTATGAAESKPEQPAPGLWEKARRIVGQWRNTGSTDAQNSIAVAIAEPAPPAWVRVLHRYVRSESRKVYLDTLKQLREPLASDAPLEKSFQLVQDAFKEGKPTEKSSHPVFKATWTINQFHDKEGSGAEEEKVIWVLLEQPLQLVWEALLEGAGGFLQKSWAENVIAPTKGLSDMEQVAMLYGPPQGKVSEFVKQFMQPFLVDNNSRLGQVLGKELPIAPTFINTLSVERQLKPILEVGKQRVKVEASGKTLFDSLANVDDEKTEFQLTCEDKPHRINNRSPEGKETTILWSPGSCGDVVITVYISCDRLCAQRAGGVGIPVEEVTAVPIPKRYSGQAGLLNFYKDFRNGSHPFVPNDFGGSQTSADGLKPENILRRYGIKKITVFYQVDAPSSLDKLLILLPNAPVPPTILK